GGAARDVETAVNDAVRRAREPVVRPGPSRNPLPKLTTDAIDLDAVYPQITPGGWLVLSLPGTEEVFFIEGVEEAARAEYALTGKTTRVTLRAKEALKRFETEVRTTTV